MIRSHALYPAELTARASSYYAIACLEGQVLRRNFTFGNEATATDSDPDR